MKKILLSGVKPTGRPHLGNYFGAMRQFVQMQNDYDSHIFIANYHALTTANNANELSSDSIDLLIDYLAIGLDPKKTTIYFQSDVPEVSELAWIFNCLITVPYLMRAHSYKDAESKGREINVGIFDYPVLMAADILINKSDIVPVGDDQRQHVEIAREIARKFNNIYGETFKEPKEYILENTETVPGIDGQKMSKSYGNEIPLFASDEEISDLVMKISTDSKSVDESKNPDENNIFLIHKLLLDKKSEENLREKYLAGGLSYKEAKEMLINDLIKFISPLREKRAEIVKDVAQIQKIVSEHKEKIRKEIEPFMEEIRRKVGIKFEL